MGGWEDIREHQQWRMQATNMCLKKYAKTGLEMGVLFKPIFHTDWIIKSIRKAGT